MITLPYLLVIEATEEPDFFWLLLSRPGGVHRHRPLCRRLPLQGALGNGRPRADAARPRLGGAGAQSQSDDRDSERVEIAVSLTAEGALRQTLISRINTSGLKALKIREASCNSCLHGCFSSQSFWKAGSLRNGSQIGSSFKSAGVMGPIA